MPCASQDVIEYHRGDGLLASRQLRDSDVDAGVRALLAYYAKRIVEPVHWDRQPIELAKAISTIDRLAPR